VETCAVSLKQIIEQNDTSGGRMFDLFTQAVIVLSLVSFSIETLPGLRPETLKLLNVIETGCIAIFTAEYLLRVAVATKKLRFVFSFFGLIDLAATLPFYLSLGLDLRSLRAVRLLRLFRAFKLFRYSKAIQRFHRAFVIAKEELILFGCVTLLLLYLSAVGIYHFEHEAQPEEFASVFDGMWWAVTSLTTVGYGDAYPVTVGGRLFTFFVLMIGLGVVAVPTGLVASALSRAREEEQDRENP
jgi:voltage-gated potassium channel